MAGYESFLQTRENPGVETLAEFLGYLSEPDPNPPVRLPRVRHSSGRAPLPKWLRVAVLLRDGFTCRWCDRQGRLEVDHIIPWSAGGSDASWNLRTLCHDCNQDRSNWSTDWQQAKATPIVTYCRHCVPDDFDAPLDHHSAWCLECRRHCTSSSQEIDASLANRATAT